MEKKYQVFISSTYADLKEERLAVMNSLLAMDCIPVGMEMFPSSGTEPFEYIKRSMDSCDYYVIIIAGRYGSLAGNGLSYTEKEYDYAVARGLPVFAFIHGQPDSLQAWRVDTGNQERLQQRFIRKVQAGRLVKYWRTPNELAASVVLSLHNAFQDNPRNGWVRADTVIERQSLAQREMERLKEEYPDQKPDTARTEIFISYARKDERYKEELLAHLTMLRNTNKIMWWDDKQIKGGDNWEQKIQEALSRAKICVLMVSANFFASDYIWRKELPRILDDAKQEGVIIIWMPVYACDYEDTGIGVYEAIPDPKKPLAARSLAQRHEAYTELVKCVKTYFKVPTL